MALTAGTRLGPYEIVSPLGAGGMGEVYRARDTKLGRDVALKILPDLFAADPERLARFEREAKTLATLNHPHIAQIHGLEESSGVRALVMELVEGEDLAQQIARGPIPVDDAIAIAKQIADALEAAHEQGIIHRDLKPANIKLRADGTVKVLDFGLAKAITSPEGLHYEDGAAVMNSPTFTATPTQIGVILGTAAYMAPEQARGKSVDKRADIWAFGCVLYEMLTGRQAFGGETVTDIVASIVRQEPDWARLPADVPLHVRRLLKRSLEKDCKTRVPDASVVRFLLDEPMSEEQQRAATASVRTGRPWWSIAAMLLLAVGAASAGTWYLSRRPPPRAAQFLVHPPDGAFFSGMAMSPDGSRLAFAARDASGRGQLWVRPIDSLTASPLAGTDRASSLAWSPDGAFIAYRVDRDVMKIAATGGPPQSVCSDCATGGGVTWGDGVIVAGGVRGPAVRIPAAGGAPSEHALVAGQIGQNWPSALPNGRHFLYYGLAQTADVRGIYVATIDGREQRRLLAADSSAVFDPTHKALLFVRGQTLLAQRFDPQTLTVDGEAVPVAERVDPRWFGGFVGFSVSSNGVLAYTMTESDSTKGLQMVWVDRSGKVLRPLGAPAHYRGIDLAPDGEHIAAHRHDEPGGDIWISEQRRGTTTRATFDPSADNSSPIWAPDGRYVAYASLRGGKWGLYRTLADGSGQDEQLLQVDVSVSPLSWSPDGGLLVYQVWNNKSFGDLWAVPLTGDRKPIPLVRTQFHESHAQISPDGRWLAYYSNETGRDEIYVRPFPSGSGRRQVSTDGGTFPRWSPSGRELFYTSAVSLGDMMAVDVNARGSTFDVGLPRRLFATEYINLPHVWVYHTYAVSRDGQQFLIPRPERQPANAGRAPIAVSLNWKPSRPLAAH